jgi:hypothetical protein
METDGRSSSILEFELTLRYGLRAVQTGTCQRA